MAPLDPPGFLVPQLATLNDRLSRQIRNYRKLERYYEANAPAPQAVIYAQVTKAYQRLISTSDAPWAALVVDSVVDRLEVSGLRTGNDSDDRRLWDIWQANDLDSESKLAHSSALMSGRAYATVWPPTSSRGEDGPQVTLDSSETTIVQYREGSRRRRVAALRRWVDEDSGKPLCTLYRPEGVYKFEGPVHTSGQSGTRWFQRLVPGEPWPLPNPFDDRSVPVVELAVNRRLGPGAFPLARGEFETQLGLLDRINLLTFLGLIVAFWMGFPLRVVIGEKILRDDKNNPLPPFKAMANEVAQFTNPDTKIDQFEAADRSKLSVFDELTMLAMLTKTPRHYFPYSGGLSNISADAIRADEGGLAAKVVDHKASISDSWEEVMRLCGKLTTPRIVVPPTAELVWMDHESRSLSERADAASKLVNILPWQVLAERILNASETEVRRWETLRQSDAFNALLNAAKQSGGSASVTVPTNAPEPAPSNGATAAS